MMNDARTKGVPIICDALSVEPKKMILELNVEAATPFTFQAV
jgi:hypothetical protein